MNHQKRKMIDAIIVLVETIKMAEAQDLTDTPDSIEFSGASDEFRESINAFNDAIHWLRTARSVTHGQADD